MTAQGEEAVLHQPEYEGLGPRCPLPHSPYLLTRACAGRGHGQTVTWRKVSKAAMSSHFALLRVRLAGRRPKPAANGTIPLVWLIAQWPDSESEPVKYWISNLPPDIPAKNPVPPRKSPLADRARLPRAEDSPGPGPLLGTLVHRLAPTRHPRHRRPSVPDRTAEKPRNPCQGLTLYQALGLQRLLPSPRANLSATCSRNSSRNRCRSAVSPPPCG